MANWYAVQRLIDGEILSFTSDDVLGFGPLPAGLQYQGPYSSQQAARQALLPQVTPPQQVVIQQLAAKPSSQWTLADIASWLQAKG